MGGLGLTLCMNTALSLLDGSYGGGGGRPVGGLGLTLCMNTALSLLDGSYLCSHKSDSFHV